MIEKHFISQKIKEKQIQEFISSKLFKAGNSKINVQRTPLGEKITIYTSRPGLVVGKKGENIKKLTHVLKTRFNMENPQIEIGEIPNPNLDVYTISERIVFVLEKFGAKRFKAIGYKTLQDIMNAGAIGAEIVISGKIPSSRARRWRFKAGYLKKSGDISENYIKKLTTNATLKSGTVGIRLSIMTPDIKLPDKIDIYDIPKEIIVEEIIEKKVKKKTKRKSPRKKQSKKNETKEIKKEKPKAKEKK